MFWKVAILKTEDKLGRIVRFTLLSTDQVFQEKLYHGKSAACLKHGFDIVYLAASR
jgi:hypothetical protein